MLSVFEPIDPMIRPMEVFETAAFEVILKIQETCNLNCSYCYMYNMGNEMYKAAPPTAPLEVCRAVASSVAQEFELRRPKAASIVLHGGEPTLMPIHRFRERMEAMLEILRGRLDASQLRLIHFHMQTNATLITPQWIECLAEYDITVSVTIDGPREVHNLTRIDHQGAGSYDKVVSGVAKLQEAASLGRLRSPGCLMVINPALSGDDAYRHLADVLGFRQIDFLLPFSDWRTPQSDIAAVGSFLVSAFREWASRDDNVEVRIFRRTLDSLLESRERAARFDSGQHRTEHFYTIIESDGTIMADESVRPHVETCTGSASILNTAISDVLHIEPYCSYDRSHRVISAGCVGCAFRNACKSGRTLSRVGSRFSEANGYANRTAFCTAFEGLYTEAAKFLVSKGLSFDRLNVI